MQTDHQNLLYYKKPHDLNRREARWFQRLQDYDFVLKHIPGKRHVPTDFLSHPPGIDQGDSDNQAVTMLPEE